MGEGTEHNPFAPPAEQADFGLAPARYGSAHLATYGQRFAAAFIDNLLYMVTAIPGLIAGVVVAPDSFETATGDDASDFPPALLLVFVGPLLLAIYQWSMVAQTGQSIAKRWLRTRIVMEHSGRPPGFVNGVLLRSWAIAAAGAIPLIGSFIGIADAVAIFAGNSRQTLHDRLARTIVISE